MSVARMIPIFSHLGSHLNAWPRLGFWLQTALRLAKTQPMPEALALDDYLPLVRAALAEDIGSGDATTLALAEDALSTAVMTAREPLVMAGVDFACLVSGGRRTNRFWHRGAGRSDGIFINRCSACRGQPVRC